MNETFLTKILICALFCYFPACMKVFFRSLTGNSPWLRQCLIPSKEPWQSHTFIDDIIVTVRFGFM